MAKKKKHANVLKEQKKRQGNTGVESRGWVDIVHTHPELSLEEMEQLLEELMKRDAELTGWEDLDNL